MMSSEIITNSMGQQPEKKKKTQSTFARVLKYLLTRGISLFLTVVVGIFLTIMIANMGGYVDTIMKADIRERITLAVVASPLAQNLTPDVRNQLVLERIALEEERLGLNDPFILRSLRYMKDALTLNLGRAQNMTSDSGSKLVSEIILDRLPSTLLLLGTADLVLFFTSVFIALSLSRRYGSFWDKAVVALSPTSSSPPWFYGIFFILIFAALLKVMPFSGMVDAPPPDNPIMYALSVLKHLVLPASALVISALFLSIYNWRTFFLIYSSEDYVEMAKARGLTSRNIERKYVLRPTLPTIITNFALLIITAISGAIITETVFLWPGLGRTLFRAIGLYDVPVIVASVIIYAYLLAITVYLLDIVYALVDPRVRIGGDRQ